MTPAQIRRLKDENKPWSRVAELAEEAKGWLDDNDWLSAYECLQDIAKLADLEAKADGEEEGWGMNLLEAFQRAERIGGKFSVETHGRGIWLATFTRVGSDGVPVEYRGVDDAPADAIENAVALLGHENVHFKSSLGLIASSSTALTFPCR